MSLERERRFWDGQAAALDAAALRREAHFVAQDRLWRWALDEVAARRPARLLDAGCGRGATTLLLAPRAGTVVGADASLGALAGARRLGQAEGVALDLVAAPLERLPFADATFDVVAGRFVLHHAESLAEAAREVARVLRPGGSAVFVETWGENPLLRFGREVAGLLGVGFGTADERPLRWADLALLGRHFDVRPAFPVFTALELANRILRRGRGLAARSYRARTLIGGTWARAIRADRWIERRIPAAAPWGWYVGLVLERR